MNWLKPSLLMMLLPGFVACSEQQPATESITFIEAPETQGCTYDGKFYSQGALKRAMKTGINEQGEMKMQENPDGPLMLCVRGGRDGYSWTTNHTFSDPALKVDNAQMTEVDP